MSRFWPTVGQHFPTPNGRARYARMVELFHVAARMKSFGVRCDMSRVTRHIADAEQRAELFTTIFTEKTGLSRRALGPSGSGQTDEVRQWFAKAGAPPEVSLDRSKRPKFDALALTCWAGDYEGEPFSQPAAALLGLRKAKTAIRSFLQPYLAVASRTEGSRIHFRFNPMGTKGERWSAAESWEWYERGQLRRYRLNAQNVPAKSIDYDFGEFGTHRIMVSLRDCFIPDPGCVWLKFDYDALEARLLAYTTGAKKLIYWIEHGHDIHLENARLMFPEAGIPADADKDDPRWKPWRQAAKACVYALSYQWAKHDGTDDYPALFKQLKQSFPRLHPRAFKLMCQRFFQVHPEIKAWQHTTSDSISRNGYFRLPQTGRMLYLGDDFRGFNQALNYQMQSGGGALINAHIPDVDAYCRRGGLLYTRGGLALLLMVHDEVDLQCLEREAAEVELAVSGLLERPMNFGGTVAGIPAKGAVGSNWGNGADIR